MSTEQCSLPGTSPSTLTAAIHSLFSWKLPGWEPTWTDACTPSPFRPTTTQETLAQLQLPWLCLTTRASNAPGNPCFSDSLTLTAKRLGQSAWALCFLHRGKEAFSAKTRNMGAAEPPEQLGVPGYDQSRLTALKFYP